MGGEFTYQPKKWDPIGFDLSSKTPPLSGSWGKRATRLFLGKLVEKETPLERGLGFGHQNKRMCRTASPRICFLLVSFQLPWPTPKATAIKWSIGPFCV